MKRRAEEQAEKENAKQRVEAQAEKNEQPTVIPSVLPGSTEPAYAEGGRQTPSPSSVHIGPVVSAFWRPVEDEIAAALLAVLARPYPSAHVNSSRTQLAPTRTRR